MDTKKILIVLVAAVLVVVIVYAVVWMEPADTDPVDMLPENVEQEGDT